jgi:hypothetical protein
VKFDQERMKTPSPAVAGLRAAVPHSQNFTESSQNFADILSGV